MKGYFKNFDGTTEERERFEEYHFIEGFHGFENDFDLDAIINETTEIDANGNRFWKPGIDFWEIAQKYDISEE